MSSTNLNYYRSTRNSCRRLWRKLMFVFLIVFTILLLFYGDSIKQQFQYDSQTYTNRDLLSEEKPESEENITVKAVPKFPPDFFTEEQRRNGFVIFHIAGLIYMFVALAIVCDEFFIPALDVITEKFGISEDVAGATFMAAGGSAPELFTSFIGVFITFDDVGIGTIVGSAVFNILFVISMCAIFSKSVLDLTWWPLFRDVSFYSIILIALMLCFKDSIIHWYEAFILLSWYAGYVTFMKYNETVERFLKKCFNRAKVSKMNTSNDRAPQMIRRKMSTPILHGGSKFRHGVLQLMIHSIDPLHEEVIKSAVNSRPQSSNKNHHIHPPGSTSCALCNDDDNSNGLNGNSIFHTANTAHQQIKERNNNPINNKLNMTSTPVDTQLSDEESDEPLDVTWPHAITKQLTYVALAPIIIPLWATLPDVRRPEKRKYFPGSFIGSILWIAVYSYLMVWWATLVCETFKMPPEIMGLTFLAAGTSIPDLITSVLVARKGLGDMAVSSSVGSNIFDVTVGLPLPWFMYTVIYGSVKVNSSGMICSILILFLMLLFVIITIAAFKWRLNVGMAIVMFFLYFVFIACSLILEKGIVKCSSIIGFF